MVLEIRNPACEDSNKNIVHRHFPKSSSRIETLKTMGTVLAPAPIHDNQLERE
jgi:hypothetical protein